MLLLRAGYYGERVLVGAFEKDSTSGGAAVYRRVLSEKKVHPKFRVTERDAISHDLVMFKIRSVQQFPNLKPIPLNADANATAPGKQVTLVGFGFTNWNETESQRLLTASVKTISTSECETRYGHRPGFLDESVTCTLGTASTSCFGDSGGPVVDDATGKLVGIISFGTQCESVTHHDLRMAAHCSLVVD
jgi:trypsin